MVCFFSQKEKKECCPLTEDGYADGSVAETVYVDINVDEITARTAKAYEVLNMAQNALSKEPENEALMDAFGAAVVAVFRVIFGDDGAEKILTFYERHYSEMLLDIFPFINNVIMPKINEASAARREQLINAARIAKRAGKGLKR